MARWAIIYNPVAGSYRARTLAAIESFLQSQGIVTIALPTRSPGHATEIARTVKEVSCVASYGGDGTLNEVANGLAGRGLPLAFLPGGTANVMAHELRIPQDPVRAARALMRGRPVEIRPGQIGTRLFLLMAGFGFDGAAARAVHPGLKRWIGKSAYLYAAARTALNPMPALRAEEPGGAKYSGCWAVVARSAHYGGRYRIHPAISLTADRLGLTVVEQQALLRFWAFHMALAKPHAAKGVVIEKTSHICIKSDTVIHVQLDGDYYTHGKEFQIGLAEKTIPFYFPGH